MYLIELQSIETDELGVSYVRYAKSFCKPYSISNWIIRYNRRVKGSYSFVKLLKLEDECEF